MRTSDAIDKIAPALVKAQSAFEGAAKSSANPHFRSKYADLAAVVDATKEALSTNGLAVVQALGAVTDGKLAITTTLLHSSGQWLAADLQIPVQKLDPQGFGSASTYGRRYALMALLGVPAVDDDGEAAMERGKPEKPQPAAANTIHEDGEDWPGCPVEGVEVLNASQAKKLGKGDLAGDLIHGIREMKDVWDVEAFLNKHTGEIATWPKPWRVRAANEFRIQCEDINVDLAEIMNPKGKAA
jgi:hypothetical protein